MLRLLIVIIILSFAQVASAVNMTPPICGSDSTGSDACLSNAVNCLVAKDPGCNSGYCGYFTANSPINIPNMFGVLLNDVLDFGTPSAFLGSLKTVYLPDGIDADTSTEGAYITLDTSKCPGSNGSVDWVKCPWTATDSAGNVTVNGDPTLDPTQASPNIEKPAMYKNNKFMVDSTGQQLYCPLMRANISTVDMKWALTYSCFGGGSWCGTGVSHQSLSVGNGTNPNFPVGSWQLALNLVEMKLVQEGDQICLKGQFPGVSSILGNWLTMACKYSPTPLLSCDSNSNLPVSCKGTPCDPTRPKVNCNVAACYLADSCTGNNMHTLSKFTLLGNFIECFTDTLNQLFIDPPQGSNCPATGLLYYFQMQMRQVVAAFLTLYVIFLGIKIASSGEVPRKGELFMFILKFALVIYFAIGSFGSADESNIYNNGLTFAYKSAFAFMNEFANNIMTAAELSEGNFCQFPPPGGRGYQDGYSYLALWDSIDCHISSYLGIYDLIQGHSKIITIMSAIFIYILGLNPIMTLFLTIFVFFMIAVMVYVANIFALCMLGMAFLVYLGPIFIPLSLFTFTKQYYDCWFKLFFSYVLQPAVVMAGFALVVVTLDSQMYNGCEFSMASTNDGSNSLYYTVFSSPVSTACQSSFGYFVSAMQEADFGAMHSIGLLTFYSPDLPSLGFLGNLMTIALLLFVFKEFVEILGALAADVTGGMNMSSSATAKPKDIQAFLGKSLKAVQSMGRNIVSKGASAAYDKLKPRAPVVPPAAGGGGGGGGGNPPPAPQYKGGTAKTRLDAALDFGNKGGVNPMFKPSPKGSGSGVVQKDAGAKDNPFYTPPPAKPAVSGAKAAVEAAKAAAVSGVSVTPTSAQAAVDAAAAVASGASPTSSSAAASAAPSAAQKPKQRRSANATKDMVASRRAAVTAKDATVAKDAAAAEAATPRHRKMLKAADEATRPADNTARKRVAPIQRPKEE